MSPTPPASQNFIARWWDRWWGTADSSALAPVENLDLRTLDHLEAASGGAAPTRKRPVQAKRPPPEPVRAETPAARLIACIQARDLKGLSRELADYPRDKVNKEYGSAGWTPFQVACQSGWRDGIVAMLPHGKFDESVKGLDGHIPFVLLAQHGFALLSEAIPLNDSDSSRFRGDSSSRFRLDRAAIREALPSAEDRMLFEMWERSCASSKALPSSGPGMRPKASP